jgi:integrase
MSKVYIENHNGRLRLRWKYEDERKTMALGVNDDPTGRAIAKQKAAQIELDLQANYYDETLLKYKPRLLGKNRTELSAVELFERYSQAVKSEKLLAPGSLCRYQGCLSHVRRVLETISAEKVDEKVADNFTQVMLEQISARTTKQGKRILISINKQVQNCCQMAASQQREP